MIVSQILHLGYDEERIDDPWESTMIGLEIHLEEIEEIVILRVEGRVDVSTSPLLERAIDQLIQEKHLKLALDFSGITYLSSAGMRVLLAKTKKVQSEKGSFVLFSVSEEVEEILKIAGFDRILSVYPTEKEALHSFHR